MKNTNIANYANYPNLSDIAWAIIKTENGIKPAGYWVPGKEVVPCALMLDRKGEPYVDRLSQDGYSHSAINGDELNDKYYILKSRPLSYAEAVLLPKGKKVIFVSLMSMEQSLCQVTWKTRGDSHSFNVQMEGEEDSYAFYASEYGKRWVLLESTEN